MHYIRDIQSRQNVLFFHLTVLQLCILLARKRTEKKTVFITSHSRNIMTEQGEFEHTFKKKKKGEGKKKERTIKVSE